jgi:hypothetical protein
MVAEWGNYPRIRAQGGERKKKIAAFPFCILQAFRRGGMNKQLLTFFALLGTFVFAATAMADPAVTAKLAGRHAHRLLIQTARHASFAGSTLRLEGVGAESVMFSDRPQRIADTMPTARLITLWARKGGTFEKVPPNAGITFIANDRLGTATVELSKPSWMAQICPTKCVFSKVSYRRLLRLSRSSLTISVPVARTAGFKFRVRRGEPWGNRADLGTRDRLEGRPAVSHISRKTSEMPRIPCTQLWTGPRVRLSLRKGA